MVRHQARAWSQAEIDAARRFGRAVLDLRQQSTLRELNLQLRKTLSDKEVLLIQKDLLMQEVNHRVQNSLQLVNSMLHLQARQTSDPQVKAYFDEASSRIMAISTVHQRLWRRSDHIQNVDFGAYLEELRDGLLESWGSSWSGHIKVHASHVLVPTNQAVILALVVTELLTNAVKYAYEGKPGPVEIKVNEKGRTTLQVSVKDQGVGMGDRLPKSGLGSRLVRSLVTQIGGELEVLPAAPGTSIRLTVPITQQTERIE
jgi:chemotaxis family two-component system sensor kinase Cph1